MNNTSKHTAEENVILNDDEKRAELKNFILTAPIDELLDALLEGAPQFQGASEDGASIDLGFDHQQYEIMPLPKSNYTPSEISHLYTQFQRTTKESASSSIQPRLTKNSSEQGWGIVHSEVERSVAKAFKEAANGANYDYATAV